jgi:hypothetical protein
MFQMIQKEGVSLLLHIWICGPLLDGLRVAGVLTESKSGRRAFAADVVVDATGDGDIAARAGAPFMGPSDQGDRMGMSLMYQLGGAPAGLSGIRIGDKVVRWGPGFSGDGLNAAVLTKAEVESRLKLWEQFKKMRTDPGIGGVSLLQTAAGVGVRERRRILGEVTVTEQDAVRGTRFPDVVAISPRGAEGRSAAETGGQGTPDAPPPTEGGAQAAAMKGEKS